MTFFLIERSNNKSRHDSKGNHQGHDFQLGEKVHSRLFSDSFRLTIKVIKQNVNGGNTKSFGSQANNSNFACHTRIEEAFSCIMRLENRKHRAEKLP